jgi:hypothetical protein
VRCNNCVSCLRFNADNCEACKISGKSCDTHRCIQAGVVALKKGKHENLMFLIITSIIGTGDTKSLHVKRPYHKKDKKLDQDYRDYPVRPH